MINQQSFAAKSGRTYPLMLSALLFGYLLLQAALIPTRPLTYDEGLNLQVSHLINRGFQPYDQIFTLANPLWVWFLGWLGRFDLAPSGLKAVFLLFGLLLLISTAFIVRKMLGDKAALVAVFLLATAITFLGEAATSIAGIIPATSFATLSLVFIMRYFDTARLIWLVSGGIVWGLALFSSFSAVSMGLVALIFIIILQNNPNVYRALKVDSPPSASTGDLAFNPEISWTGSVYKLFGLWLTGAIISVGMGLWLVTPDIIFNHIFANQAIIRDNIAVSQPQNFRLLGQFAVFNMWLAILAVYSLSRVYDETNHPLWLAFTWGLINFGWLVMQINLRLLDFAILLPPLSMLGAWGLLDMGSKLKGWSQSWQINASLRRPMYVSLGVLVLIIYVWSSHQQLDKLKLRDIDTSGDLTQLEQRPEIVNFIAQHTSPDDCVMIDDAALAAAANRFPAPQLVAFSREQINGGFITEETLAALTQEYECSAVVFSNRTYTRPLSNFRAWARAYYPNQQNFTRTEIYYQ